MDLLADCSIVQLVAAGPGWHARYRDGGRTNLHAVAVWALVEGEAGRQIVGLAPDGNGTMDSHAEELDGFDGYVFVSPSTTQVPSPRAL